MDRAARPERDTPGRRATPVSAVTMRPYEQLLSPLLLRAREAIVIRFRPHLQRHGFTEQQWRVLRVLAEHHEVELLELSARCLIRPPSLSRMVPALVDRGLLNREMHPADHRRALVSLTGAGRELFEAMAAESTVIYAEIEAELRDAGLMDIYSMLNALIAVLGAAKPEVTPTPGRK